MTQPLISVVIATRDRAYALKNCLDRVFSQDSENLEVIVVDNSSDEDTADLIREYEVIYLRESPKTDNVSYLKNIGVKKSSGEIIAIIDDDSIVQSGWLQTALVAFSDPEIGGISGRVIEAAFPEDNSPIIAKLSPAFDMICNFNNHWPQIVDVDYLYGCNMLWRRQALIKAGIFDNWMHYSRGEQELSIRVKRAGYRLIFHPGVVVQHLRAPRANGAVQRSGNVNFRSRMIHCRSLTYQYARHFGISKGLLKLTLWTLPKGNVVHFLKQPNISTFVMPFYTLFGVFSGFVMAMLTSLGFHEYEHL